MKFESIDQKRLQSLIGNDSIYLQVLDYLQDVEKSDKEKRIKAQKIGIEKALKEKRTGSGKYGRPNSILPDDFFEVAALQKHGMISLKDAIKKLNMKRSTYYSLKKKFEDKVDSYWNNLIAAENIMK